MMDEESLHAGEQLPLQRQPVRGQAAASFNQVRRILGKLLRLPLFIFPRSLRPASNKPAHELHPTAYLDALRGYAAWIVYNYHVLGRDRFKEDVPWMEYPFIRIWGEGMGMVDLFFVISGFALTYSAMGHMHNNAPAKVLDSLASSMFRRHFRLYLPLIPASFVTMVAIASGVAHKSCKPNVQQETVMGNLWYFIQDTVRSSNPFPHVESWWSKAARATHTRYIPQAWTIPVEFRGSLVVFMFCVATCKMTTRARQLFTLAAAFACFWWMTPYAGMFLFGMWLADRRHQRMRQQEPSDTPAASPFRDEPSSAEYSASEETDEKSSLFVAEVELIDDQPHTRWASKYLPRFRLRSSSRPLIYTHKSPTTRQQLPFFVLCTIAICLLASPLPLQDTSPLPYRWMRALAPPTWEGQVRPLAHWPYTIGSMMLCYSLDRSPILQKPFTWPVSQFLGELSFGIYIMHNLVRWIVWEQYFLPWGQEYAADSILGVLPGYIVMTTMVLWAAEGFRRVDVRCVRFTKWLQTALWAK